MRCTLPTNITHLEIVSHNAHACSKPHSLTHFPSTAAPSKRRHNSLEVMFPNRSVLTPPAWINSYNDYENWVVSAGGDLSSDKKRHTVRREDGHITRPPNSFMLFRSWTTLVAKPYITDQSVFSKGAGFWWADLTEQERDGWRRIANIVKENHTLMHPDYKYTPNRTKAKTSRLSAGASDDEYQIKRRSKRPAKKQKAPSRKQRRYPLTDSDSVHDYEPIAISPALSYPASSFSDGSQTTLLSQFHSMSPAFEPTVCFQTVLE
jgi:hypothetical protein